MDQIKLLVKDVLHKIQDIPDVPFPSIKMSDLTSTPSLSASTSAGSVQTPDDYTETTASSPSVPNQTEMAEGLTVLQKLYTSKGTHDSNPSLKSWTQSEGQPVLRRLDKSNIIMGKNALLRSRSVEMQNRDAAAVHDLVINVHEKYHDKIYHYIDRMHRRRLSRECSIDDDATSSNYSITSLRTPDSFFETKSYFAQFIPPKYDGDDSLTSREDLNGDTFIEYDARESKDDSNEFDPKLFLMTALGDVSLNTEGPLRNPKLQTCQSVEPPCSAKPGTLLTRAGSLCSLVRRSFSFKDKIPRTKVRDRQRCQSFSPDYTGSSKDLSMELSVQNGIILQAAKALSYCKSCNNLYSPQYVEAEKILLVASCQKEALQAVFESGEVEVPQTYSGSLQISNLIFNLKLDSNLESSKAFDDYYVVVITCGKTVLASKVLLPNKDGEVRADKTFLLEDLHTDFGVTVAIYSMRVKQLQNSNTAKHKKERKTACPSTKGLFHLSHHHKSSRRNLLVENSPSIKSSSFNLFGSYTLRCGDLDKTHFRMHHVPLSSCLEGVFSCHLTRKLDLKNRTSGFITLGYEDKTRLLWNRRWCVLDGSNLKYWNYPSEEFTCPPVGTIDLTQANEEITPADRTICPRPKSLCLLINGKEDQVLLYFLSFDSVEEKEIWTDDVNSVIGTLRAWKCLGSTRSRNEVNEMVSSL